jgi:hypothetical protein
MSSITAAPPSPTSVAFYNGFIYFNNGGLCKMAATGASTAVQIDTVAGAGAVAYDSTTDSIFFLEANGTLYKYGQGLLANKSLFGYPQSPQANTLAVDSLGNVYYMDIYGSLMRLLPDTADDGVFVELGNIIPNNTDIQNIAIDASDNIYVYCHTSGGHRIIKVDSSGRITDNFIVKAAVVPMFLSV